MKSDDEKADCRASAFQELCHPESTYLEKAPTVQLTRIDAGYRLFSVPLTGITSVPECAVSSVGFLWGSAAASPTCGVFVGLEEALTSLADQAHGIQVLQLLHVRDHSSSNPAWPGQPARDRWYRALPSMR